MSKNKRITKSVLYMEVKDRIKQYIVENDLQPHDLLPSEAELAETYGVSRMTCKLALQQLVDEGQVYRLPRRGTFVADGQKQSPTSKRNKPNGKIGLVVPHIDEYVSHIITSVVNESNMHRFDILLRISDGHEQKEDDILEELAEERDVQGIILFPVDRTVCGDGLLRLKLDKFPVVVLDRVFKEVQIDSVSHDHYQGAYAITEYLIRQGHQQIGYISHTIHHVTSREERFQGFMQCMLDHDVPFRYQRNLTDVEWPSGGPAGVGAGLDEEALAVFEHYLTNNSQLTAVFCMDDYLAAHVLHAAQQIGRHVPNDLSVTGFLDLTLTQFLSVPLTTVRQPTTPLGEEAVRLLLQRLNDPDAEPERIQIPTEVIVRDSVGAPTNMRTNV